MFSKRTFIGTSQLGREALAALVLADVRFEVGNPGYLPAQREAARPAGSVAVPAGGVLGSQDPRPEHGRLPLPKPLDFANWCQSSLGIGAGAGKDRPVLCFDDKGGAQAAARLWWMLTNLGVEAYILDGGWQAYQKAGLPTESGPEREALQSGGEKAAWAYRAAWSDVVEHPDDLRGRVVVDARVPLRHGSTVRPWTADTVPGCVSDSVCFGWNRPLTPDMTLRPSEQALADLRSSVPRSDTISPETHAFMCASGVTACFNIAVAAHVGLGTPALFPGSWSMVEAVQGAAKRAEAKEKYGVVVTKVVRGKPFDAAKPTKLEAKTEGGGEGVLLESAVEAALMENLRAGEEVVVEVKSGPSPLSVTAA